MSNVLCPVPGILLLPEFSQLLSGKINLASERTLSALQSIFGELHICSFYLLFLSAQLGLDSPSGLLNALLHLEDKTANILYFSYIQQIP